MKQLTKKDLKNAVGEIITPFAKAVQKDFKAVNNRLDKIDKRLDQHDKHFDEVDKRFDRVDKRFDDVDKRFDVLANKLFEHDKRFDLLEFELHDFKNQMVTTQDKMLVILNRLDQKRVFTTSRIDKIEKDVETNKIDIKNVKQTLKIN